MRFQVVFLISIQIGYFGIAANKLVAACVQLRYCSCLRRRNEVTVE